MNTDCISRQAVIDSLYDWSNHSMTDAETWHLRQVIGDIKSMPSVTPQEPILDKIRAEIKALTSNRGFLSCSVDYIHEEIDAVFDKYKAESEAEDGNVD